MQPAHFTKHLPLLPLSFRSSQFSLTQLDNGQDNGTAVWLSGQALALTLPALLSNKCKPSTARRKAIELGSGTGFTALALCSLGWDVLATDTHAVLSSVLQRNIDSNRTSLPEGAGVIQTRELDWTVQPEFWTWSHPSAVASHNLDTTSDAHADTLKPPFDLVLTADTIYSMELLAPLFRTLHALCLKSNPSVFLALERRDHKLAEEALRQARDVWLFALKRISGRKVLRSLIKANCKWNKSEWEGVEIWRLTPQSTP